MLVAHCEKTKKQNVLYAHADVIHADLFTSIIKRIQALSFPVKQTSPLRLHFCILLADRSRLHARSGCKILFSSPRSSRRFVSAYPQCFLWVSESCCCQKALCNRCNLRGGGMSGGGERGQRRAWVVWSKSPRSAHARRAKPTKASPAR